MKVSVAVFNEENPPFLSEIYIKSINNEVIDIQHFDNLSLAIDSVKKAKAWGVLHIKPNFSETLIEGFENIDEWDGDEAPDDRMKLYSDLSCIFKTITATKMLDEAFVNFSANALTKLNYNPSIFNIPIQMGEAIHGTLQGGNFFGLKTFYIPGVLIIISYTISFAMTILAVIAEKTEKILDRNYAAGVSPTHLILGHLLTRLTFMSINLIVVFFVAIYGFHIPTNGSRTLALALLILQCIAGLTNGLVISALLPNLHYAAILSNGILLFMFIASGVLWSVGSMPYWFRWLSYFMPTTIPTESFRHILSRGLPFSHFEVYSGFLVTIFYIFVFFLSSIFFFRH
ncbi:ABC transporter G family member 20-like protein [Dinothrombium tinctorium]|uniref:ABC transporter G family member 20-like protein n=1 Tax=Dinothrombium tinctorium TaxID=1965070 RepID=A0A3S3P810_9ACAR|nr:ABC transporter G family member 20-like protein [Dinothrombium tinctorium]